MPRLDSTGSPSYMAVASALIADIKMGRLMPGDSLPSQRSLAKELDLSLTTITRAFKEAQRRGLIVGHRGRGTFVNSVKRSLTDPETQMHQASRIELSRSSRLDRVVRDVRNRPVRTKRLVDHSQSDDALDAAVSWLRPQLPGIDLDRVIPFENEGNALITVLSCLIGNERELFVETLLSPALLKIADLINVRPIPIDIDSEGLVPEALESAMLRHRCRVLYCSPTFQNPTNTSMSTSRRQHLASIARQYGVTIIENGSYDRLASGATPLSSLEPDLCFYSTSLATTTFGAIQGTYVATPTVSQARRLREIQTGLLLTPDPLALAPVTRAILDRTLDAMMSEISRDISARTGAARSAIGNSRLRIHAGSPFGWLALGAPLSSEVVCQLNGPMSFVFPEKVFAVAREHQAFGLRVSFGCFNSTRDLMTALTELEAAIK